MGKKIFDSDNRFNRFMTRIFNLMILNLLWMLCCIPIVTIGASTVALYTMTLRLVRDEEGSLTRDFFKAFRENLRQTVPVTLVFFFLYTFCLFNILTLRGGEGTIMVLLVGNIAILVLLTALWVWIIPLIARYENTLAVHFNNSWRLAVGRFPYTLTFIITTTAPLIWVMYSPQTFLFAFPLWFLLGGAGAAAINSVYLRKVFDEMEGVEEDSDKDL